MVRTVNWRQTFDAASHKRAAGTHLDFVILDQLGYLPVAGASAASGHATAPPPSADPLKLICGELIAAAAVCLWTH